MMPRLDKLPHKVHSYNVDKINRKTRTLDSGIPHKVRGGRAQRQPDGDRTRRALRPVAAASIVKFQVLKLLQLQLILKNQENQTVALKS